LGGRQGLPYDGREAVREAADEAGLSLSEWLAQAAEAKIRADGQARILEEAERERRFQGLREFLDEYQAEHGAFTDEEMAEALASRCSRDLATGCLPVILATCGDCAARQGTRPWWSTADRGDG
jgi:hypothetical protein